MVAKRRGASTPRTALPYKWYQDEDMLERALLAESLIHDTPTSTNTATTQSASATRGSRASASSGICGQNRSSFFSTFMVYYFVHKYHLVVA
jgi:hypothetical protein